METETDQVKQSAAELKKIEVLARVVAALPNGTTLSVTAHHHTIAKATHVVASSVTLERLPELVRRLSRENVRGCSVIARPAHAEHSFLFLDDTDHDKITQLQTETGIAPCLIIKTSSDSRQALYVSDRLDKVAHNLVFTTINKKFGDVNILGADHSFKVPGFAQRKPERARADGLGDWVVLEHASPTTDASLNSMRRLVQKIVAEAPPAIPKARPAQASRQPKAPAIHVGASSITADAYARLQMIVIDRYRQSAVTFSYPDYSKVDFSVACWLFKQPSADRQAAYKLLSENSPMLAARHPSDADRHITRTLANAGF